LQVGDFVYYHGNLRRKHYGSFAPYAVHEAISVVKIENVESNNRESLAIQLASLPCAGWTAYYALFKKLRLMDTNKKIKSIMITAGAGGVGGFALQLVKQLVPSLSSANGGLVLTSCSPKNSEFVKSLGAHVAIDYTRKDQSVAEQVLDATGGRGVDAWVDCVDAESVEQGMKALAFGGEMVVVVSAPANVITPSQLMSKALSVHFVALGAAHAHDTVAKEELHQMGTHMAQMLINKQLNAMVGQEIPFEGIKQGLEQLQTRHVQGKIVAKLV